MTATDWLTMLFFSAYVLMIIISLANKKRKDPSFKIRKYLSSELIFIPGMIIFSILIIRLLLKTF